MKKLIIATISALLIVSTYTGCKTQTPATTIYKVEGGIITTVDTGMQGWAMYVNQGHGTQVQIDAVKNAYNTYYNAQIVAKAALEQYMISGSTNTVSIATASLAVSGAETSLLSLLNQYIIKH
jgi:hypothetical protein